MSISASLPETLSVGTAVLTVFGASSWTGADLGAEVERVVQITNCGDTDLYARTVTVGAGATVSTTNYERQIPRGDTPKVFPLAVGQSLQVVRGSGTGNVCARRLS